MTWQFLEIILKSFKQSCTQCQNQISKKKKILFSKISPLANVGIYLCGLFQSVHKWLLYNMYNFKKYIFLRFKTAKEFFNFKTDYTSFVFFSKLIIRFQYCDPTWFCIKSDGSNQFFDKCLILDLLLHNFVSTRVDGESK